MNNLQDVWRKRFLHYVTELQKYMKYVFTGHLAIVFVFVIGAGGYQYSEWLKTAPGNFPATWFVATILGLLLAYSPPTTLIREPDQVYLLPVESKLMSFMKKALNWTFWSQIFIVLLPFVVAIPLLRQVGDVESFTIGVVFIFVVLMKLWNVRVEFSFRWASAGKGVWGDRIVRAMVSIVVLLAAFTMAPLFIASLIIPVFFYANVWSRQMKGKPFPYEHFIKIEQNRMLRFYRFANYFTDVPHIRGSIRRRAWLDWVYRIVSFKQSKSQEFLVFRTFVRTDDTFYLWVRLTVLSALGAFFIGIPIVVMIFVGALAFASTLQLKQALSSANEFRMDMLYPLSSFARVTAVEKIVRIVQIVQAFIVLITILVTGTTELLLFLAPAIIVVVSEITLRLSK
ncbi:MAG: ABC transporter permease [Paenisporosarcina sp.]